MTKRTDTELVDFYESRQCASRLITNGRRYIEVVRLGTRYHYWGYTLREAVNAAMDAEAKAAASAVIQDERMD